MFPIFMPKCVKLFMKELTCRVCRKTLPIKHFHLRLTGTYRRECKICQLNLNRNRYKLQKMGIYKKRAKRGYRIFCKLAHCANAREGITNKIKPFDLWAIARKQKLKCPYTDEKLTNETLSLDHIVPLARGGANVKENLQFVHYQVNVGKSALLHDEFLALCHAISKNTVNPNKPIPLVKSTDFKKG